MELVVDETHLGTPESEWQASPRLRELPLLAVPRPGRVVVVSPHPDDEIFGAGGLMQQMQVARIPVEIIAVSDGEASHPAASARHRVDLRSVRAKESAVALERLGWTTPVVRRLSLPDGRVGSHMQTLTTVLSEVLSPDDLCLAPWWNDGHPDHNACGEAARAAATSAGALLLGYLVWAWHWADPHGSDLPWHACRRLEFDRHMAARKRWATGAFRSQTRPLDGERHGPVLPAPILRRFWRRYEVFVDAVAVAS